jgi:hypothetical protein
MEMMFYINVRENRREIKNEQSRDTGNIGFQPQCEEKTKQWKVYLFFKSPGAYW